MNIFYYNLNIYLFVFLYLEFKYPFCKLTFDINENVN